MNHEPIDLRIDPVHAALSSLRSDDRLEIPDPALERALWQRCHRISPRARRVRVAATLLLGLALAGAAGAAIGIDRIRRWWYAITVGGQTVIGTVEGDGERRVEFTATNGAHVTVHVRRSMGADQSVQTGISVSEQGPHHRLEQEVETVTSGGAMAPERLGLDALASAEALHTWTDADGHGATLYLGPDPVGPGSRLLVHEQDAAEECSVVVLARVVRPLGRDGRVEVIENKNGGLRITLDDGHGWVLELTHGARGAGDQPTEVITPDGQVRVRVDH